MAENEPFEVKWSNPARISSFSPNMGIWGSALSRARAALQHNPLLLLMCAMSVLIHKTAATTAAPISGGFGYRCAKYQTDCCALTAQLVAFASALFVLFRFVALERDARGPSD